MAKQIKKIESHVASYNGAFKLVTPLDGDDCTWACNIGGKITVGRLLKAHPETGAECFVHPDCNFEHSKGAVFQPL